MKRTTYILIGVLASVLVVIVVGTIAISLTGEKKVEEGLSFDGEKTAMDVKGVYMVKVFINRGEIEKRIFVDGRMEITSSPVGKGKISYPKSPYLNIRQKDDTLLVELDFTKYAISEKYNNARTLFAVNLDIKLAVDSTLKCIVTNEALDLNLKDMKTDSLLIRAYSQKVLLDSCQFRSFDVGGYGFAVNVGNSKIENYYLNLNGVSDWTFQNSEIDTEFLSGSSQHTTNLQKGECRRVVWERCSEDATLQVMLREKAEIKVIP